MRDRPLQVRIEEAELVIRIGIGTLIYAAERCPRLYDYDRHKDNDIGDRYIEVEDENEFVKDTIHAMQAEEEDGSTPLSDFLDQMVVDVYEDGSAGIVYE